MSSFLTHSPESHCQQLRESTLTNPFFTFYFSLCFVTSLPPLCPSHWPKTQLLPGQANLWWGGCSARGRGCGQAGAERTGHSSLEPSSPASVSSPSSLLFPSAPSPSNNGRIWVVQSEEREPHSWLLTSWNFIFLNNVKWPASVSGLA